MLITNKTGSKIGTTMREKSGKKNKEEVQIPEVVKDYSENGMGHVFNHNIKPASTLYFK
jgi:hypothetical protein